MYYCLNIQTRQLHQLHIGSTYIDFTGDDHEMPQKEEKVIQGVDRSTPDLRGGIFSFPPFPNNNHAFRPCFLRGWCSFLWGKG